MFCFPNFPTDQTINNRSVVVVNVTFGNVFSYFKCHKISLCCLEGQKKNKLKTTDGLTETECWMRRPK